LEGAGNLKGNSPDWLKALLILGNYQARGQGGNQNFKGVIKEFGTIIGPHYLIRKGRKVWTWFKGRLRKG